MPANTAQISSSGAAATVAIPAMEARKALRPLARRGGGRRINTLRADKMEWWASGGECVRQASRWFVLAIVALCCALVPIAGWEAPVQTRLLDAAGACLVQPHAFYIEAAAAMPRRQARAVLRLADQAMREWPAGEAASIPTDGGAERVTLAAACPPDAAQARAIERRMRMLLGHGARVSICLTGRVDAEDLFTLAERALMALNDWPQQALREAGLVSLTGERAQVALRGDEGGAGDAMIFLGSPLVSMDY